MSPSVDIGRVIHILGSPKTLIKLALQMGSTQDVKIVYGEELSTHPNAIGVILLSFSSQWSEVYGEMERRAHDEYSVRVGKVLTIQGQFSPRDRTIQSISNIFWDERANDPQGQRHLLDRVEDKLRDIKGLEGWRFIL